MQKNGCGGREPSELVGNATVKTYAERLALDARDKERETDMFPVLKAINTCVA